MTNRLADAASPYLRAHADNPVDWWPWSEQALAEAEARDVPVFVSIGYATCHWCHVMARESFSDPELAAYLNAQFVSIKVDREEHPEVDASYLAAASAFTGNLGWPLSVFATPDGAAFFAGTYFPPRPVGDTPSFRMVLEAIVEAWQQRRDEVEGAAEAVLDALAQSRAEAVSALPTPAELTVAVERLASLEDPEFGGLGRGSKFPNAPVLAFLTERGAAGDARAAGFAARMLATLASSPLRDSVVGGFFRYAVERDWSQPHYERMLSDNAQLLALAATTPAGREFGTGIARFLLDVLRLPAGPAAGAFASALDSESPIDGVRSEGGYYALDAAGRARQPRPALDAKVLTGLNGMAIGALAVAGSRWGQREWVDAARVAADAVLGIHLPGGAAGPIARASLDGRLSDAVATLEDIGGLAGGLLRLALATGEARYAVIARTLVERTRDGDAVAAPGGIDPVLARHGLAVAPDLDDGATPSGAALLADAAVLLWSLSGDDAHRRIAEDAIAPALARALDQPSAFGAALAVASRLAGPVRQLVVVADDPADPLAELARLDGPEPTCVVSVAQAEAFAASGFGLFEGRSLRDGRAAAYLCEHFVCRLPVTTPARLAPLLTP
ncbi:thioredoxin domain-containing protein [Lysinimonas soli]|uniref:Thioredoxin domain-containing protein n=1 Tax=Lysinimonas soli TaxID=1074233 RepID=A0ABW0NM61_9MICO